jgi:hypothetical protein
VHPRIDISEQLTTQAAMLVAAIRVIEEGSHSHASFSVRR